MNTKEKFFDSRIIANFTIAFTLIISIIFYLKYSTEIEDQVTTVIVHSLKDVSSSLAEQESAR